MTDPNPEEKAPAQLFCEDGGKTSAAFHTGMAHLYRGEMHRMTAWRIRLDTTSHWGIILSIGLTTFALGSSAVPHYIMLLALAFNTLFMIIEGRRYQHLHHSKWRLSLMEHNYLAALLSDRGQPVERTWCVQLAADLRRPHFTISLATGTRLRLRRNYLMLMYFVTAVWIAKLFMHPRSPRTLGEFFERMSVGDFLPSGLVAVTAALFVVSVTVLAALTPSEEALERWSSEEHFRLHAAKAPSSDPATPPG